jgi:hypothetical protein
MILKTVVETKTTDKDHLVETILKHTRGVTPQRKGPSMNLIDILHCSGMSSRPGFYSGRGANGSDLTARHLDVIWVGIKAEFGEAAADSFVLMVEALPILAATDFLLALFRLETNDWRWSENQIPSGPAGMALDFPADTPNGRDQAMGHLFSLFGGANPNDPGMTWSIKREFLRGHGRDYDDGYRNSYDYDDYRR